MRVEQNAPVAGKCRGFNQRLPVAVHRLARRHHHLTHTEPCGIVIGIDHPRAVGNELVRCLEHFIGDRGAFGLRQGVSAARGVKPQAQQVCRLELTIDERFTGVAREAVLMIERRRASVLDELGHGRERRMVKAGLREPRKDRVDQVEPFDDGELCPIEIRAIPDEGLKEMMVRVHEARIDKPSGGIVGRDTLKRAAGIEARANRLYRGARSQKIHVAENLDPLALAYVGDDGGAIFEKYAHRQDARSACKSGSGASSCKRWIPGISMKPGCARIALIQIRIDG